MNVNFPERIWCNSSLRRVVQRREVGYWKSLGSIPQQSVILEIGCGNGAGALMLMEAFGPRHVFALDSDMEMLRLAAKRREKRRAHSRLTLMQGDAQYIPLADKSVDAAFNFGIIHHLEDWRLGLNELGRVIKPGGSFFFEEIFPPLYANAVMKRLVLHPTDNRFHGPEFVEALEQAGLKLQPTRKESRFGIVGLAIKQ